MKTNGHYAVKVVLTVALGGFLMGFDASVISGVVGFIEPEFGLSKLELGWAVSSLTLTATVAMMLAGPLSDRIGRRPVLMIAAVMFAISAVASALATNFTSLVLARMLGGIGVGGVLIIAPMYIAEMSPPAIRGRMVSLNQLNIVVGISAAFFSNFLILRFGQGQILGVEFLHLDDWSWRWMLGIEALPALVYLAALFAVPESPRWLIMHDRDDEALAIMRRVGDDVFAEAEWQAVRASLEVEAGRRDAGLISLLGPALRFALLIGIAIAVLQQITGINAVFFYAPTIFEQSGIGTDASFLQAVLVGVVNPLFTVAAILLIDRLGRRPLLAFGFAGIAACMLLLAWTFSTATYAIDAEALDSLPAEIDQSRLVPMVGRSFDSDVAFRQSVIAEIGDEAFRANQPAIVSAAISVNARVVLFALLGFVASFAVSVGPIMWVLFSELFPNRLRGIAVSFVGFINSAVSFTVQLIFPWELDTLGNSVTFLIYGMFAVAGLLFVLRFMPETRGKSLETLAAELSSGGHRGERAARDRSTATERA